MKYLIVKRKFVFFTLLSTNISFIYTEELLKELPASSRQKEDLAESVCLDLSEDMNFDLNKKVREDRKACERNFLSHNQNQEKPSKLTINNRSEDKVSFTVTPSKQMQVVALVNENEIINYRLINRDGTSGVLNPYPFSNYTLWTASLSKTVYPSLWRRGPTLLSWQQFQKINTQEDEQSLHKKYDIKFNFLEYEKNSDYISARFWWNSSDPLDLNFNVLNICLKDNQGNMYDKMIGPESNRSVILKMLPLDDKCQITIIGKYNTTKFVYRTLACHNLRFCKPLAERAKNVTLKVSHNYSSSLWSVRVRWATPQRAPDDYNVTLQADNIQSVVVQGNVTEVNFKNVKGDVKQMYNVSIAARNARGAEVTSRRDYFPDIEITSSATDIMLGASWTTALFIASALIISIICIRRRLERRYSDKIYFPDVSDKVTEDSDTNSSVPESSSEDQWEVRPERLLLHEVIGEGAFGVVRRSTLAPTNKDVAVKMLKDLPTLEEIRSFRSEMELMKSVGAHPHVVSLVGCYSGRRPLIVAEYCSRGDLLTYLRCSWDMMVSRRNAKYSYKNKESSNYRNDLFRDVPETKFVTNRLYELQGGCDTELTLLDLLSFCRQIAMGMEFLASNRVVHRDLAARNVLVTTDRTLKIADFGLSRDVYQQNQYRQNSNGKMPVKWMALESLTHRIYTTQTDVWSFGVVMWEVITMGGEPYSGASAARLPRLLVNGYRMPRPQNCSITLYELMLSCWSSRPRCRPSFSELHHALDDILTANADHYLPLALPALLPDVTPEASLNRYVRNLIRGKRRHARSYDRPLTALTNHFTAKPAHLIQI